MNNEELKNALLSKCPVTYDNIQYKCISAIIYRAAANGKIIVQAELMDKHTSAITIARPDKITIAK